MEMYDFFMILLSNLWDLPSATFVGITLLAFAYTHAFKKSGLILICDLAYPVGVIGLLIGLVGLLQNVSDLDALTIIIATATTLVPLIYAAIGYGIACGGTRDLSETESSPARKVLGTIIFLALVVWAADKSASLGIFVLLDALVFTFVGIIALVCADSLLKKQYVVGWSQRLLGIAFLCFLCGLIGMLANLDERRAIGPAAALSLLGLLYPLVLVVIGRIWVPEKMLNKNGSNGTGLLDLVFPVLFGLLALSGLMASSTIFIS
jgi:hypothetical protein